MEFTIRMGHPEMLALWNELQTKHRDETIKKKDEELYKKFCLIYRRTDLSR